MQINLPYRGFSDKCEVCDYNLGRHDKNGYVQLVSLKRLCGSPIAYGTKTFFDGDTWYIELYTSIKSLIEILENHETLHTTK